MYSCSGGEGSSSTGDREPISFTTTIRGGGLWCLPAGLLPRAGSTGLGHGDTAVEMRAGLRVNLQHFWSAWCQETGQHMGELRGRAASGIPASAYEFRAGKVWVGRGRFSGCLTGRSEPAFVLPWASQHCHGKSGRKVKNWRCHSWHQQCFGRE